MPKKPETVAAATEAVAAPQQEVSLLDSIIEQGIRPRDDNDRQNAKNLVQQFVTEVMMMNGAMKTAKTSEDVLRYCIHEIDKKISQQLNEVMHAPEFQKLEASWRGLHYLVQKTETSETLKIRVLNAPKKDLVKDVETAVEFDQSVLFKQIYEQEFGTFGGSPYGVLIGDYEFGGEPQDIYLLEKISNIAAAAHAPFIAAAHSRLFNLDSFAELGTPRDLAKIFDNKSEAKYVKWAAFRKAEDSRYVGLTLPHILLRGPYGNDTVPVEAFDFEEDVDGKDHGKYLWGNAAYAFATLITNAFAKYNWCTAIRGVEGGGLVEGLPTHSFRTDDGEVALKCPTEIAITDRRENELATLGFIPLIHCKGTNYAAFFGASSTQKPQKFYDNAANANARLSAQLQYIMATARFAHYLKAMMRDKIGSFMERNECETFLNKWIKEYTVATPGVGLDILASHPLRAARIEVSEVPGKPGVYKAVAFLKPHFQLDELSVSLRLVAELPPPARG
ncbi:MAG: type VI secretion system contractile sheath large subunit [bacterium]